VEKIVIIKIFTYLNTFWVEKLEELACMVILVAGPSLENYDPEPSEAILRD
jgi:hypothetical protein